MKFMAGTALEDLNAEFIEWQLGARKVLIRGHKSGAAIYGIRFEGQRFGQYFWNHYGAADQSWPELFYEEDAAEAYRLVLSEIVSCNTGSR